MRADGHIAESGDVSALHQRLVDNLKRDGYITTPCIEAAFRTVPRHLFLPSVPLEHVYSDEAITTKSLNGHSVSSSSQPSIMAIMLEQLALEPGQRVLEIGAGTGYNAALMVHIVGDTGQVITLDIDEDIVESARAHLTAGGFGQVQALWSDGGFGYPSAAPYDRIILTVGAWDIAPAWRDQLRPKGRLVLPISLRGPQRSVAFEFADDHLTSVSIRDCGFMTLRGAFAAPSTSASLGPEPGLSILFHDVRSVDSEVTYKLLTGPHRDWPTGVNATRREIFGGLILWLALRERDSCWLVAEGAVAERAIVPDLFRFSGTVCATAGLHEGTNMCVLMGPPGQCRPSEKAKEVPPFELFVRSFGPDDDVAHRLIEQITAWDTAGRPSTNGLRIRAYPMESDYVPSGAGVVISKRWTRLVLDWP